MADSVATNLRLALSGILFFTSIALLSLTAYHVHFTEVLGDVLDPAAGGNFYVPIVVELLVTSCLAILFCIWFYIDVCKVPSGREFSHHLFELIALAIIWIMYLTGAIIVTRRWPDLSWCRGSFVVCRVLNAIVGFSWTNWSIITLMFVICMYDRGWYDGSRSRTPPGNPQETTA